MAAHPYTFLKELSEKTVEQKDLVFHGLEFSIPASKLHHEHIQQLVRLLNDNQFSDFLAHVELLLPFYGFVYAILNCPKNHTEWEEKMEIGNWNIYVLRNRYRNFMFDINSDMSYVV